MNESEGLNMEQSRERFANEVDVALAQSARRGCGRFLGDSHAVCVQLVVAGGGW